jgi:hypothetical protein
MRIHVTLTDETATEAYTVRGWESFLFASGNFASGQMVTEFSPDGSTWFPDENLTFSEKSFETFRAAPTIYFRFRMEKTLSTPNVVIVLL